jgi:hypothetical protein
MKKKARFSRSAMPGPTRTTKVLICVALCLSVVAVVFSQWRPLSSTVKLRAFSVSAPVPSPTIPPPTSPSKEYIYAGGRLIATEEGVNLSPTVSVTSPTNNFTFTSGANLPIVVTAADTDGTISQVQIYQGTTLLGAAASGGGGIYNYSWTSVAAGSYALTARATDNGGAITTSSIINVISNAVPTVSVTSPANNFTFTSGSNLPIVVSAADADGTISQVQMYQGATLLGAATSGGGGIYNYSWTSVAAGSYALTARATDNSGAITSSSIINVISNTNAPPTVNIWNPVNNFTFVPGANLGIDVLATDTDGTISQVQIYRGATLLGQATSSGDGIYNYSWNNVAAGSYALTARATDNSGAITASSIINVNSNAVPTVSIGSPANNYVFNSGSNLPIVVSAADADGSISQVQIYRGATLLGAATSGGGGVYNYSWTSVAAGSYALTARATDNSGAITASSIINVISNAIPTVSVTSPANNFIFTSGANLPISVSAADTDGTISQVQIYQGATLLGAATSGGGGTYNYSWNNVAAGSYALTARATDNRGAVTTSVAVTVISNAAPTVGIASPANNSIFTAGSNLQISVTAADATGTISRVDIYQGTAFLGQASPGISYLFLWSNVPAGTYALTAKATDNHGAVTTSAVITVISNVPPTASIMSPANNSTFTAGSNLQINTTAADANGTISRVDIYQGATFLGQASSGISYLFLWNNVPAGTYALTARATDNHGAITTSTAINISSTVGFNGGRFAGGNPTLTAMNLVPDGRLFVCRQTEQLKNGAVLPTPFISPAGNSNGEPVPDGTLEPGVASNRFVCVYSASTTSVHNRVSRFTATEMWRWLVAT